MTPVRAPEGRRAQSQQRVSMSCSVSLEKLAGMQERDVRTKSRARIQGADW